MQARGKVWVKSAEIGQVNLGESWFVVYPWGSFGQLYWVAFQGLIDFIGYSLNLKSFSGVNKFAGKLYETIEPSNWLSWCEVRLRVYAMLHPENKHWNIYCGPRNCSVVKKILDLRVYMPMASAILTHARLAACIFRLPWFLGRNFELTLPRRSWMVTVHDDSAWTCSSCFPNYSVYFHLSSEVLWSLCQDSFLVYGLTKNRRMAPASVSFLALNDSFNFKTQLSCHQQRS